MRVSWRTFAAVSLTFLLVLSVVAPIASSANSGPEPGTAAWAEQLLAAPHAVRLSGMGETALRRLAGQIRPVQMKLGSNGAALGFGATAPNAPTNTRINAADPSGPTCATQSETHILDAGGGKIVAGYNNSRFACTTGDYTGYSVSTDGGVTWTDKSPPPSPAGQVTFGDPVLAKDRAGNVYFSSLSSLGLTVHKMAAGSTTFGTGVDADPGTTGSADKEWLAVGPNPSNLSQDYLYLGWIDFGLFSATFRMSRSTNGGASWQALGSFAFGCSNCQGIFPVVDQTTGKVYAFYEDFISSGSNRAIRYKESTDGGNTWSAIKTAANITDSTPSTSCGRETFNFGGGSSRAVRNSEFPSAAIAPNGVIVVVWNDGRNGTSDIFATVSTNSGATWRAPFRVNSITANQQFQPSVAADTRGAHFQWYSGNTSTNQVTLQARSYLAGTGFTAETQISSVSFPVQQTTPNLDTAITDCYWGDYNQLGTDGTMSHYIWGDTRNVLGGSNNPDVFVAKQ